MGVATEANIPDDVRGDDMQQVRDDFQRAVENETYARARYLDDIKFANADTFNGYQWNPQTMADRELAKKACITVNKTRQHNLIIINDAKMNKPGIKVIPTGNGATFEAAQAWMSLFRYIEYHSKAPDHYNVATTTQVQGGIGYLRVLTEYANDRSFDQDIRITSIPNPLMVYIDPDAKEPDKSDARYCFIYEDLPNAEFRKRYARYAKEFEGTSPLGMNKDWVNEDHTRVCEYYTLVEKADTLVYVVDPESGEATVSLESEYRKLAKAGKNSKAVLALLDEPTTRKRPVTTKHFEWWLVLGEKVVEKKIWPCKYIPIIPVVGEETIIEGQLDRKGHTRALRDPQNMYNFYASEAVTYGALQTKTPWILPVEAVEGFEDLWGSANLLNQAYLPYNALGEDGEKLPPPQRIEPPVPLPLALKGMELAIQDMQMVSGQWENQMGQQGNERTGAAIEGRQRQSDKATYHFVENLAIAIRQVGRVILDLAPKIYDTRRVFMMLGDDNAPFAITSDPAAQQAYAQEMNEAQQVVARIFNPQIGEYDVQADVGPGFATKRQQAFEAFSLILTQNPQLTAVIGDILLQAGDFPYADKAAERLRNMVPPQALGKGPSQQEQALAQQVQLLQQQLKAAMDQLTVEKAKGASREEKRDVDVFNALTNRLKVLGTNALSAAELAHLLQQTIHESDRAAGEMGDIASDNRTSEGLSGASGIAPLLTMLGQGGQGLGGRNG